jgi:hypothetical protein
MHWSDWWDTTCRSRRRRRNVLIYRRFCDNEPREERERERERERDWDQRRGQLITHSHWFDLLVTVEQVKTEVRVQQKRDHN